MCDAIALFLTPPGFPLSKDKQYFMSSHNASPGNLGSFSQFQDKKRRFLTQNMFIYNGEEHPPKYDDIKTSEIFSGFVGYSAVNGITYDNKAFSVEEKTENITLPWSDNFSNVYSEVTYM